MSQVMDRRIAERRRTVTEAGAQRRMRWLLASRVVVSIAALGGWFVFQFPYLAVAEITIDGDVQSRAAEIVAGQGVEVGLATIRVRPGALEAALLADPWIAAANVRVTWPGTVSVEVREHSAFGWVEAGGKWLLTTAEGWVVETAAAPLDGRARISVGTGSTLAGESVDPAAIAALDFIGRLPGSLAADAVVIGTATSLSARVGGHEVVLGYPAEMGAKAAALAALLEAGVPDDAEINLIAPDRPAVMPRVLVEPTGEVFGPASTSG